MRFKVVLIAACVTVVAMSTVAFAQSTTQPDA